MRLGRYVGLALFIALSTVCYISMPISSRDDAADGRANRVSRKSSSEITEVYILGMHHSGTSLLTALLALHGGHLSSIEDPKSLSLMDYEKKHYVTYEDSNWRNAGKAFLQANGLSWFWVCDASSIFHRPVELDNYADFLRSWEAGLLANASRSPERVAFIKDPASCMYISVVDKVLRHPVKRLFMVPFREATDVAASLSKTDKFLPGDYGAVLWAAYNVAVIQFCRTHSCLFMPYSELLMNPLQLMKRIHAFLRTEGVYLREDPDPRMIDGLLHPAHLNMTAPCASNCYKFPLSDVVKAETDKIYDALLARSTQESGDTSSFPSMKMPSSLQTVLCNCTALRDTVPLNRINRHGSYKVFLSRVRC